MMLSNEQLRQRAALGTIKRWVREFRQRKEQKMKEKLCALRVQKFFRAHFVKNTSFIEALRLHQFPRLYLLKEQKPLFLRILKTLLPLFEAKGTNFESLMRSLKEDTEFDTVRVAEPDL